MGFGFGIMIFLNLQPKNFDFRLSMTLFLKCEYLKVFKHFHPIFLFTFGL